VPISRRLAHHWGLNGAGKNPTGAPLPRWARVVQQGVWVIGFGITATFVAVAISAALDGRWLIALIALILVVWRVGVRRLIKRNQREVDRWQRKHSGPS
jgi:hypothetical protein